MLGGVSNNHPIKLVKSMLIEGYEAHIFVDGVQLPEFVVSEVELNKMVCYIPSEAGKISFLCLLYESELMSVFFHVSIDVFSTRCGP